MTTDVSVDRVFQGVDFREKPLPTGEYIDCCFKHCRFQECDLGGIRFEQCRFEGCDLSLAKVVDTAFRKVEFANCKMLGVHFESCNPFALSLHFTDCLLNYCSFFRLSLRGTRFRNCRLIETDWADADFSESLFEDCDLAGAIFDHTNLEYADFRTAVNYLIHPESNRIKKAKFSLAGLPGLLLGYQIEVE